MSDDLDQAQAYEARDRQVALARALSARSEGASATDCMNCGKTIPPARRQAVPGVKRCIACQEGLEG